MSPHIVAGAAGKSPAFVLLPGWARNPHKPAMVSHLLSQFAVPLSDRVLIANGDERVLTYVGLQALSARLGGALQALGVRPGDRVAAQVEKSPEAIALYLATVRAG